MRQGMPSSGLSRNGILKIGHYLNLALREGEVLGTALSLKA
jgi:hypothetical protein